MQLDPIQQQAQLTLSHLMPRLEAQFAAQADPADWDAITTRLNANFSNLFGLLLQLYGGHDYTASATRSRTW